MAVKSGSLKSTKSDKSDKSDGGSKSGKEPLSLLKESNVFFVRKFMLILNMDSLEQMIFFFFTMIKDTAGILVLNPSFLF